MGTKFLVSLLTWLEKNGSPCYRSLSLKKCLSHPRQKLEVRRGLTEAITAIFRLTRERLNVSEVSVMLKRYALLC